jgi:hypothetical protein
MECVVEIACPREADIGMRTTRSGVGLKVNVVTH